MTARIERWLWKFRVLLKAGTPDQRLGTHDTLQLARRTKSLRIAPTRLGRPVASFWSFRYQGDEIYVEGRTHAGVHKLSFHKSGKWFTTLGGQRKELAPGKLLDGGHWRHALQLRYLVGDSLLDPLPDKPFRRSDPGYAIECPPGHYLLAHLLIGTDGTTLETPLPEGYRLPRLLPITLRGSRCAMLVGGPLDMPPNVQRELQIARAMRYISKTPPDLQRLRMEVFQVEVTAEGINRVTVIPLGPEAITTTTPPGGIKVGEVKPLL